PFHELGSKWSPTSTQQRLYFRHFGGVMLEQHLRVVVGHFVRRMSAPVSNDLTAHPGINEVRNPASPKSVHPHAWLDQLPYSRWVEACLPERSIDAMACRFWFQRDNRIASPAGVS